MPIGISFEDEEFEPWTESTHRFRYYEPPKLVRAEPDEIEVGKMAEVYIFADENSEFWERNYYKLILYSNAKWRSNIYRSIRHRMQIWKVRYWNGHVCEQDHNQVCDS